jgi:cyanophycin synthetase
VVPLSASRAVVLNAEDPLCVAMARRVHPDVEIIYFSMEADNPVLLRHLAEGGRATYLQDNAIVVADATYHQELLRVETMPIAFGGRARYNIANALAAAAGLMASGFSNLQIATGLSTFVSDSKSNPLRTNVFDIRGVTVIVDYAHNSAAYTALAEMARALLPGQLVGHRDVAGRPARRGPGRGRKGVRRALRRAGGVRVGVARPAVRRTRST